MKLLITGSRKLSHQHYFILKKVIEKHFPNATEILHGGARGGDQLAARYAIQKGLPQTIICPDYKNYPPKFAPLRRNSELVKMADATLAIYAGTYSNGTRDTALKSIASGKPLLELLFLNGRSDRYRLSIPQGVLSARAGVE